MPDTEMEKAPAGDSAADEALWAAFLDGDNEALETLIRRYAKELFWYLLLSTGQRRTAGRHLIRVWNLLARWRRPYEGFETFRNWLYAVATQNCVPPTHPESLGLTELVDDLTRGGPADRRAEVFFRITDLRRHLRQPFLLVTVAGLDLPAAARACNFSQQRTAKFVEKAYRRLARLRLFPEPEAEDEV